MEAIQILPNMQYMEAKINEAIERNVKVSAHRHTFWDMKELCHQTNMSENFIKDQFFYDEEFPKRRVGRKWLMPAKETEAFLLAWLKEQSRY